MRPQKLYKLFSSCINLKGVGAATAKKLEKLCGSKLVDILWHLPVSRTDRRNSPAISSIVENEIVTLELKVQEHISPSNRKSPYKIVCSNPTGFVNLVFFKPRKDYLQNILPVGATRIVSGKAQRYGNNVQITHPDYIGTKQEENDIKKVEPIYPLTAGLSNKLLIKSVQEVFENIPSFDEWIDKNLIKQKKWPDFETAIKKSHNPIEESDLSPLSPHRERLAYDELLSNQLALALVRAKAKKNKGISIKGNGVLRKKLLEQLEFDLTSAQKRVLEEIFSDMQSQTRMLRLLQGDVGSGKTIVSFLTMLNAVEQSYQSAIMAPTDILAKQHYENLYPLAEKIGIKIDYLSGKTKAKKRKEVLENLKTNKTDILIGTHALFQKDVEFYNLACVVIDEQHRFGVHQRLMLAQKGNNPDVLVMTATPIPRTLTLTIYGDMEVSKIDEMPPNRQKIDTRVMPISKIIDVIPAIKRALDKKAKVYWVCPLVEESEKIDLAAAEERYEKLKKIFGVKVGLVHGRMKKEEKDQVMEDFQNNDVDLLVATTVIEVGVNVPDATIMIVENAQRFGLAQLHQLRGRVGRASKASTCLLLYSNPLSENSKERLKTMRETQDGFLIAEKDLKLRGSGEILGTKQSGMPEFRVSDLMFHAPLLQTARKEANFIVNQDPELKGKKGKAIKELLYLFEQDSYIKNLHSG